MDATIQLIMSTTADCCFQIARNKGLEIDKDALGDRMRQSFKEWYIKITDEAKRDSEKADILGNLQRGKIDTLVRSAFSISIVHGCTNYAKYLLNIDNQ